MSFSDVSMFTYYLHGHKVVILYNLIVNGGLVPFLKENKCFVRTKNEGMECRNVFFLFFFYFSVIIYKLLIIYWYTMECQRPGNNELNVKEV